MKNKSRYGIKKIDSSFYGEIKVQGNSEDSVVQTPGAIYVPWRLAEHTEESLADYTSIMVVYKKLHAVCPRCGATGHSSTLVGYPLTDLETYQDKNSCVCINCGDRHIVHDRISEEQFKMITNAINGTI